MLVTAKWKVGSSPGYCEAVNFYVIMHLNSNAASNAQILARMGCLKYEVSHCKMGMNSKSRKVCLLNNRWSWSCERLLHCCVFFAVVVVIDWSIIYNL